MKIKQVLVGAGLLLVVGACGKTSINVNPPAGFKCPEGTSVTYREGDYERYEPVSNPNCLDRYARYFCEKQSTDIGHYSQWLCIPNPKDVKDSSFIQNEWSVPVPQSTK